MLLEAQQVSQEAQHVGPQRAAAEHAQIGLLIAGLEQALERVDE